VCVASSLLYSSQHYTLVIVHPLRLKQTPKLTSTNPGSQVILYFTGASLSFIEADLNLARGSAWLPTANILAIAAVCPYAGYLQDLFGKRYIALFGSFCICLGCALMGSGQNFGQLLAGMAISGAGAATGELTGLAG
jgi:MFS family permease